MHHGFYTNIASKNYFTTFITDVEDTESYSEKYSQLFYIDWEKQVSLVNKNKQSFSVLSKNSQSLNAKIDQLGTMYIRKFALRCRHHFSNLRWLRIDIIR